jgi:phasin
MPDKKTLRQIPRELLGLALIQARSTTMQDPFKTPQFEVPQEMRDLASKSVEQARRAFDSFVGATQDAAGRVQGTAKAAQDTLTENTQQAVGFAEQNVKAALDHAQKLVQAKGLSEVMQLQSEFMRNQMSAMQDQMKAMGDIMKSAMQPPKK